MFHDLYQILNEEVTSVRIRLADETHKIFQAHFPGNPLLPAFVMIEMCSQLFVQEIKAISKAKFMQPVLPDDVLDFCFTPKESKVHVRILREEKIVAEIVYETF